ncbi:MAG: hypothetical protein AB7U39_14640 [Ilumatobacteraceae bacterium]
MNDSPPRCAGPGTACRLVQLETPGPRPVWAILDAAGLRRFTGELTMHCHPAVRAYFNDGEVYFAEREGDPPIGERLLEYGVVTPEQLAAGSVQLGAVTHLGRLFDRVPDLDRDPVEVVLELVTGEVLGEIADHTADGVTIASYRHHPSGVWKWRKPTAAATGPDTTEMPITEQVSVTPPVAPVALAAPTLPRPEGFQPPSPQLEVAPTALDDDLEPTESDLELVAEYEEMMAAQALAEPEVPAEIDGPDDIDLDVEPLIEPDVEPVAEHQTFDDAAADVAVVVEPPSAPWEPEADPADQTPDDTAPFTFEFDLNKVLAQVAAENDGLPVPTDDDVDDDVRAAVRAALAEIEAATRPPVTHGLSAAAFEIALGHAPETAADIETPDAPVPWLPSLERQATPDATPAGSGDSEVAADERAPATVDVPATGLRRLIAPRKP